jgi:drug/metabolite transporter (DMT)-like permease
MSIQIIGLLALAAVVHSVWNLLSKQSIDKQVFLWLAVIASLVIYVVPFWYLFRPFPLIGLGIAVVSGVLEAVYYLLLGTAYQLGDLSLVYPLARGSAPLFVTLFALVLLGERPSAVGIAGILLIVAGIYTLHLRAFDWRGLAAPVVALRRERVSQLALLVGVVIATYSVVDKVGVTHVNPMLYIYVVFLVSALVIAPYMLLARRASVAREWGKNRFTIVAAGIMFVLAYVLVLIALTGTQVSFVASVREMSVVFGAALGTIVLREAFGPQKLVGALLIFGGIVCIGLTG